jgi:hypothetical protein
MTATGFCYAQARLQARHGQRADERLWARLQGIGDLSHYLQVARRSVLQGWVAGMQPEQGADAIEVSLRRQLRDYAEEVAGWLPLPWRAAMGRVKWLFDLAALQHLLSTAQVPAWMEADPLLAPFTAPTAEARRKAIQRSEFACLARNPERSVSLYPVWLECWQQLWPQSPRLTVGLLRLAELQQAQAATGVAVEGDANGRQRLSLQEEYQRAFRRYAFQPAAAFAHLALVSLDVQRLRGGILRRLLFDAGGGTAT